MGGYGWPSWDPGRGSEPERAAPQKSEKSEEQKSEKIQIKAPKAPLAPIEMIRSYKK